MIICKECGFKSADADSFCGACGGFLEWTGERQATVEVVEDADEPKRKVGLYERLQKVIYADVGEAKPVESANPGGPGGPGGPGPSGPRPPGGPPSGPSGPSGPPRPSGPPSGPSGPPSGPPRPSGPPSGPSGPPSGPPRPSGPPSGPSGLPVDEGVPAAVAAPAGPSSTEARDVAAALVARAPTPSAPGAGPALPTRTQPVDPEAEASGAPMTDQRPPSEQPAAIQPQAAQRRKPPKVQPGKPTRTPQKGDLICGECGEANVPGRKFCSRCGASLAAAAVVRIPFWKRMLPKRRPKSAMAGERPWSAKDGAKKKPKRRGMARFVAPVRRVVGIVLLIAGIVYGVYSPFREWVNERWNTAKGKVESIIRPSYEPVTAGPGTTSNEVVPLDPAHPAALATDGFKNTYWLSSPPTGDFRPELDVALTAQVDLTRIIVHSGAADNFQGHHRPRTLLFIFDTGASEEVSLKNTPEPQTITIHSGNDVQRFKIAVTGIYESIDGTDVALDEIEFFEKR